MSVKKRILDIIAVTAVMPLLCSCFTGIENTGKIKVTKADRRLLTPSPEEELLSAVRPAPLAGWKPGKEFAVIDSRADIILRKLPADNGSESAGVRPGAVLFYEGATSVMMPDGREYARLVFGDSRGNHYGYDSGKLMDASPDEVLSDRLPMMVDMDMANAVDSILRGKTLWSRSHLIYDRAETRLDTLKFIPFQVDSVSPGSGYFPLRLWSHDSKGLPRFFFLDFNSSSAESRPLNRIFFLTDPHRRYPHISDEVWALIQARKVRQGMTKEECRLSLGAPSDADSGRDYNSTLDLWQYPDGSYLRFVDGLLDSYRL